MCGIAGYIGKNQIDEGRIRHALSLMKNRGPDHSDYKVVRGDQGYAYLLHSRLSIIDLDPRSNQPFCVEHFSLIFNGEIYNYKEIREELRGRGITFHTESDTEVLLRAYMEYGEQCVDKFEGMWAFAIYDEKKRTLFLSRDRFAEKPLYYFEDTSGVYFASEIKFLGALRQGPLQVNYNHLKRYMINGYKSLYKTSETFYMGVREIPPATNITLSMDVPPRIQRYWQPQYRPQKMSIDDAVSNFRQHFLKSIKLRLRSDVPMAFCLSGGVDSAAIVSAAAKTFNYDVHTFSIIDSDERYNERTNIEATLKDLNCRHTVIDIPKEGFLPRLRELIKYHDAPLYTLSYYIHSFLSQSIAEQGYKVVCSGTAADELVTGYYDHFNLYFYEMRTSGEIDRYIREWRAGTGQYVRNPYLQKPHLYFDNPTFRDHIYLNKEEFASYMLEPFEEPFTEEHYSDALLRNRMMNEMFHEGTRVILHEDDLNSMKYSIENRSPYLDRELFEFSYTIPTELLIQKGLGKYILREAVQGILNDQVRLDDKKVGFNASIHSLIDFKSERNREWLLDDSAIFNLIDRDKIAQLIEKEPMPNSLSKYIFNFINTKIFLEQNKNEDVVSTDGQVLRLANQ